MNIRAAGSTLIVGALLALAPLSSQCVAQTNETKAPIAHSATPNTNTASPKHRYWRFRGGQHPHYGSRRVRT